jgi:hypothetical protein
MTAVLVIEGLAIILLAVLVVGLLRSNAEILRALHDLGVRDLSTAPTGGVVAPRARAGNGGVTDVSGLSLAGSAVHIGMTGTKHATMLAFLSTGCSACVGLWEGLGARDVLADLPDVRLVVVTKSREAESQSQLEQLVPEGITLVQSTEAWESYGVPVSPYFVLVDGAVDAVVGEGSAGSWAQVTSLLGQALADKAADRNGQTDEGFVSDAELRRAGIGPGHPSLYPETAPGGGDG